MIKMITEKEIIQLKKVNEDQAMLNKELINLVAKLVDNRIELLKEMKNG